MGWLSIREGGSGEGTELATECAQEWRSGWFRPPQRLLPPPALREIAAVDTLWLDATTIHTPRERWRNGGGEGDTKNAPRLDDLCPFGERASLEAAVSRAAASLAPLRRFHSLVDNTYTARVFYAHLFRKQRQLSRQVRVVSHWCAQASLVLTRGAGFPSQGGVFISSANYPPPHTFPPPCHPLLSRVCVRLCFFSPVRNLLLNGFYVTDIQPPKLANLRLKLSETRGYPKNAGLTVEYQLIADPGKRRSRIIHISLYRPAMALLPYIKWSRKISMFCVLSPSATVAPS